MRGACACALVCALLALSVEVVVGQEGAAADDVRAAAERQLLALLGLPRRPPRRAARPPVPAAMRLLYESSGTIPAAAANTARSFHHAPSVVDDRFPNEHRFRLFFNVSAVPTDELVRGAELSFQRANGVASAQRLLLYDVVRPGRRGQSAPLLRLLDSVPLHAASEAVTADALGAARRWALEPRHNHGLLVRVVEDTPRNEDARQPHVRVRRRASESEEDWRAVQPLLLLYTEDERAREARESRLRRAKRATQRRGHRAHHRRKEAREICQRRPLFVDFADVGWSDWIVAPHGYDAYYCQGECPFPLADHLNGTNHAIVQTLVNSVNPALVPKACCVPTQLSSISMLYMDEVNNVVLKNYQDMIVVGCGCR